MGVKVATTCFQWPQPVLPHSSSSSQALASAILSPSSKRRCRSEGGATLVCRLDRSALFGSPSSKLRRSRSYEYPKSGFRTMRRACSANLDAFSDEEFSKKIQELALRLQLSDNNNGNNASLDDESEVGSATRENHYNNLESSEFRGNNGGSSVNYVQSGTEFSLGSMEAPNWPERDYIIPASIERKANSVNLPLSLRMIKKKMQWQEGFREAGESAYCSVKKAFSSMVFIIRELQSYTLQMREVLFYEDLQGIVGRVQKEMNASFVWLFQQVFSHTPTLMVSVMILLANFSVYSMASNTAIAAALPSTSFTGTIAASVIEEVQDQRSQKFDSSAIRSFLVSSSSGKTTSIGGNNGGGGKVRPAANGTDGDGKFDRSDQCRTIVPDGASQVSSPSTTGEAESISGQDGREEEIKLWNSVVEEASRMQASVKDESLDHETMQTLVSPVNARIEPDNFVDFFKTELFYRSQLTLDPNNPLLLANYAQFLFTVVHDYDRAEDYFKKATAIEPPDAEAYSKYAFFLWKVKNDLWAAEETFLGAIDADPNNAYYPAYYAHFLWNTGADDTCFPLSPPDTTLEA